MEMDNRDMSFLAEEPARDPPCGPVGFGVLWTCVAT